MVWYVWLIIALTVIFFISGLILLPPRQREIAFRVILFPLAWLLCIVTFPFHYFKNIGYNEKKKALVGRAVRIDANDDFMIKVIHKDGREQVIKPFNTEENNDVSSNKE